MNSGYFKWLLSLVGGGDNYRLLLTCLSEDPFTWVPDFEMDSDRAEDGIALRNVYSSVTGKRLDVFSEECSVLEMLIALAARIDRDIFGEPDNEYRSEIFWRMLDNAGLLIYTDRYFDSNAVVNIVDNIMLRQYDRKGTGSFFPVRNDYVNQRANTIWDQMNCWIIENY